MDKKQLFTNNRHTYAGCPSCRAMNVSTFQSINLVMTYNYFWNKNIWTFISSLYLIIIADIVNNLTG